MNGHFQRLFSENNIRMPNDSSIFSILMLQQRNLDMQDR